MNFIVKRVMGPNLNLRKAAELLTTGSNPESQIQSLRLVRI